jgi:dTDP-4-amino-4,6-dideoxygalactose transaminase
MKVKFFNPGLIYKSHKEEFDSEMQRVLEAGDLILRSDVDKFEKSLAEYVGTKYAVALNSCTDALYLALRYLGIGKGDEVLVPSRTFNASVSVIEQVGATPVFYDLNGSVPYSKKIKAVIPVHIEGAIDTNLSYLLALADVSDWYVIEDSAQALGAMSGNKKAGSIGDCGCFSFYPAKILGAFGDAGALTTNDEKLYNWVRDCRNHFKEKPTEWGINSRLDNLQAAFLNIRFKYLPEMLARRKEIADRYLNELKHLEKKGLVKLPENISGRVWQDFCLRTPKRDELYDYLKENGIETLKNNYPFPVPKLPMAQEYEDQTLRLPCNETLTDSEVDFVIVKINEFFKKEV